MSSGYIDAQSLSVSEKTETQELGVLINLVLVFFTNEHEDVCNLSNYLKTSESQKIDDNGVEEDVVLNYDIKVNITSDNDILSKIVKIDNIVDEVCLCYSSVTVHIYILTDNESPFTTYFFFKKRPLAFILKRGCGLYAKIKYADSFIQMMFLKGISDGVELIKDGIKAGTDLVHKINTSDSDGTPSNSTVQIAALLSHYVYFYLDWLEVYWDDYPIGAKCSFEKDNFKEWNWKNDQELVLVVVKKYNSIPPITMFSGIPSRPMARIKVKLRVVARINEILNIVNINATNKCKIINQILEECAKRKAPIDFYELYSMCFYFPTPVIPPVPSYIDIDEAKKWHVCHPMLVAKKHNIGLNVIDKLNRFIRNDDIDNENGEIEKTNKTDERKRSEIFGYKKLKYGENESFDFYYTPLLHSGMDRVSGYGGALFVKIDKINKEGCIDAISAEQFIYATKGTDFNSLNDWVAVDILQAFTGFSLQHAHTILNAQMIDYNLKKFEKRQNKKIPLTFVGHSLGGGLASSNAIIATGRHAITFNAASLNFIGTLATKSIALVKGVIEHRWSKVKDAIYPMEIAKRVHPIRIEGEAIDVLQIVARLLTLGTCERAYGCYPLIISNVKGSFGWGHGMNNYLYKSMMDLLGSKGIVNKTTIVKANKLVSTSSDLSTVEFQNEQESRIYLLKDNIAGFLDISAVTNNNK